MHQSRFEYGLTRQYPFRWFTPVAVIGGIILLVVFSFINLGANAFDTVAVYTNDPNGTKADELNQWYMKVPFNWGSTFKPDCEPRQLSVGDQFFTTNQGFYYKLKSIKKGEHILPSIRYINTTLQECITRSVEIRLRKSNIQPDATMAISWGSSELSAAVECTVYATEIGFVDLAMVLEFTHSDLTLGYPFHATAPFVINDNYTTHASVWWGSRLLSTHWTGVLKAMATAPPLSNGRFWMRGSFTYAWANKQTQQTIHDDDFFLFDFFLLPSSGIIATGENWKLRSIDNEANVLAMYANRTGEFSAAAKEGLQLAKVVHSLISTDLGNNATPNYLLRDDALQNLLAGTDDYNRQPGGVICDHPTTDSSMIIPPHGDKSIYLNESYQAITPLVGKLGTQNATIYTQYSCTVHQRKNVGIIIVTILIADLVFLQAAWTLFKWTAGWMLSRQDPRAMFCEGCAKGVYGEAILETVKPGNTGAEGVKQRLLVDTN